MRPIQFKLLRYALVPFEQGSLLADSLPDPKGRALRAALPIDTSPRVFAYRNRELALVGFDAVENDGRFIVGRLAKKKEIGVGQLGDREIVEVTTDDWLPVWMIVDLTDQYIAVEMHHRFGNLSHVIAVLQSAFSPVIEGMFRHEVLISPITDARKFWDILAEYPLVFRVSLRLVSPNFIDSPRELRETLEMFKEIFNPTETNLEFRNDEGQLEITEKNLSAAIEYISIGEGEWTTEVGDENGRKHTFSSKDDTESFKVEVPRASTPPDELSATTAKEETLVRRFVDAISHSKAS